MVSNIFQRATWIGTDAERLAFTPDYAGVIFYCTDTSTAYWWDGAAWQGMGGGGGDASTTTYTPAVVTDWDGDVDPGNVDGALDQLADRVTTLETGIFVRQTIFTYTGNLVLGGGLLRLYNKTGATQVISQVFISVNTAPTGANIIVDIHKSGTTIFTNQAHRPEIVAAGFTDSTTDIDVPNWADGEYLTAIVDQIGSTITGANLTIHVVHSA